MDYMLFFCRWLMCGWLHLWILWILSSEDGNRCLNISTQRRWSIIRTKHFPARTQATCYRSLLLIENTLFLCVCDTVPSVVTKQYNKRLYTDDDMILILLFLSKYVLCQRVCAKGDFTETNIWGACVQSNLNNALNFTTELIIKWLSLSFSVSLSTGIC